MKISYLTDTTNLYMQIKNRNIELRWLYEWGHSLIFSIFIVIIAKLLLFTNMSFAVVISVITGLTGLLCSIEGLRWMFWDRYEIKEEQYKDLFEKLKKIRQGENNEVKEIIETILSFLQKSLQKGFLDRHDYIIVNRAINEIESYLKEETIKEKKFKVKEDWKNKLIKFVFGDNNF